MNLTAEDKKIIEETKKKLLKNPMLGKKVSVGSTLITKKGKRYFGVSLELYCGVGNCAEHAAASGMVADGETYIKTIVAVHKRKVIPPCGKCREFLYELNKKNLETEVIVSEKEKVKLKELLPDTWQKVLGR